jgi:GrpB-like predicted nucleotidyltransferase (UPF0157 family)
VLAAGAEELRRHMVFRDALRADKVLRDTYAALKRSLALQYKDDRSAYNEAKSAFVNSIAGTR